MTADGLEHFCKRWLDAWTGNRPEELLAFYTEDAFYRDPARPLGLTGKSALADYFRRLLAANPNWKWEAIEVFPTARGFALKWRAAIPVPGGVIEETGLDLVELDGERIRRNEVYFDRAALLAAGPPL